jgi:hypothetical protein
VDDKKVKAPLRALILPDFQHRSGIFPLCGAGLTQSDEDVVIPSLWIDAILQCPIGAGKGGLQFRNFRGRRDDSACAVGGDAGSIGA